MREVFSDIELGQARAAIELVRAAAAEATCRSLLLEGDPLGACLEHIVLEQALRELGRLPLTREDAAYLAAIKSRFNELTIQIRAQ